MSQRNCQSSDILYNKSNIRIEVIHNTFIDDLSHASMSVTLVSLAQRNHKRMTSVAKMSGCISMRGPLSEPESGRETTIHLPIMCYILTQFHDGNKEFDCWVKSRNRTEFSHDLRSRLP